VEIVRARRFLSVVTALCLVLTACAGSGSGAPHASASYTSPPTLRSTVAPATSRSTQVAPYEATVRSMIPGGADRFGWVEASAKDILATYYPPGSGPFIGGRRVNLADRIIVVKMHGTFSHSGPPGAKTTASLALAFYDITTRQDLGFRQMWDGNAPDLGVGGDPGLINREAAAQWWDLRLLGNPAIRTA
jgi:hypothetical protein